MRIYFLSVALICLAQTLHAEEVRLVDLEPNDAQNLIDQQDQSLKYAPKIDSNVPAVRYLGQEPHNVLEDIYLAKQYHGQDGLGGYLYGYQVPDIAKNEQKKPGGDLRGAYNYVNGAGQEIKVEYWDDGTGFHQVDNIPDILPQQIDDSPEVKAAKDAFLKLWQEEAERNQQPVQSPYNSEGQYASGPLSAEGQKERAKFFESLPPNPVQKQPAQQQPQQRVAFNQPTQIAVQPRYQAAASVQQGAYAQQQVQQKSVVSSSYVQQPKPTSPPMSQSKQQEDDGSYTPDSEGKYIAEEGEESTGPPRGFFYAFDYPVGIITQDQGRALPADKSGNLKNIYEENRQRFERQLRNGRSSGSSQYLIN